MKRHPIINKILAIAFAIGFMALTPITTYAETITIFDDLVPLADPAASEDVLSTDQTDVISVAALEDNVIGTATWSFTSGWSSYTKQANFYLVDENGAAADFYTGTAIEKEYSRAGTAIGADTITSTLGGLASTDAYTVEYQGIYTEATGGYQITDVKYQCQWSWSGTTDTWSVQKSGSSKYTELKNNDDTISLYVRYKVTKNTGITISDETLTTDGRLAATFVATEENQNVDADSISYTWSKSTDGGNTYTPCEDKVYKISSSEEEEVIKDNTINIVLDGGVPSSADATVTYKVEAFTTNEDGTEASLGEATYDVKYYSQIINGSFETPAISGGNDQFKNADHPEVVWHATAIAKNTEIELVNCKNDNSWVEDAYSMYPSATAADGDQFAELNCEAEAALYQDVLTIKGQTLNYWFSHRARGSNCNSTLEYDEMYLVIMPREIAMTAGDNGGEVDTQSELKTILGSAASDSGIKNGIYLTGNYAGTFVRKVESSDQSWTQYTGTYNVSSYATRFFFVASTTASGSVTVGNFLDNIGFSTDLPPVKENQAQMTVEKVISGLTQDQAQAVADNIEITITATNADGKNDNSAPFVGTIKGSDMSWTWNSDDGTYVGTYDFGGSQNIGTKKYNYTAVENSDSSGLSVSGYILTPTKNITASDTAVKNADGTVTMRSKSNIKFTFNDSYSAKITNPDSKFDKTAEVDNYDNRTYTINLQAQKTELEVNVDQNTDPIDLVLVMDVSGSMLFATDLVKVDTSATLDTNTTYYTIDNDAKATVYRVVYNNGTWQKRDDSYKDGIWTKVDAEKLKSNSNLYLPKSGVKATRLSKFQETAKKLVNNLPENSNVTLITFAKGVISNNDYKINSTTKSSLCTAIENITTTGGTRQDLGLQAAKGKISNLDDSNKKFVVLLTDGCPNADDPDKVVSDSKEYANEIKNSASIFTIGIDLDVSSAMGTAKNLLYNCASEPKDSFYYNVTGTKLDDALTTITASMLQRPMSIKATTGKVTDIVDSRFDLLDDNGNKVTSSGTYKIGGINASVTVNNDGTTTITWDGVALGKVSGSSCSPWSVSFKIQAKDDFLGGNLIATNGSDSGVDTNNDGAIDEKFPQPAVNVKPLDIKMGSNDEYVFLGDKFTVYQDKTTDTAVTSGALNWLLKNITTKALQDTVTTQMSGIISNIKSEGGYYTYTLPYSYGSTDDKIGNIVFTFTPADNVSDYIGNNGEAKTTTNDGTVATWKLSVQYKPLSTDERQALDTAQGAYSTDKNPGTETATEAGPTAEGTYTDHVVTLALNIKKQGLGSDGETTTALGGAKFTLMNGISKVAEGTSDSATGLITFDNLKTGTYTIKETEAPSGWALNDTEYTLTIAQRADASADGDKLYNVKVMHGTATDIDCTVNVTKQTATLDGKKCELSELRSLLTLTVTDQMAYELPHTGGSGIYLYTISGILLLMAAALLIYKQKNHK